MSNIPRFPGTQLAKVAGYDEPAVLPLNTAAEPAAEGTGAGMQDYLRFVHGALRGRYVVVILLSIILGGGLGFLVWNHVPWPYKSEGIVSIAFAKPVVLAPTESNTLPMYQDVLQSEKTQIMSREVADLAVQDPIWKENGIKPPHNAQGYFAGSLEVTIRGQLIVMTVTDNDPIMAATAATAIVNAYKTNYESREQQPEAKRTDILEKKMGDLQDDIADLQAKIRQKSDRYGTADLSQFYGLDVAQYVRIKTAVDDVNMALAGAPAAATEPAGAGNKVEEKSPEQIAMVDGRMAQLVEEVQRQEEGLAALSYLGDNNRAVVNQRNALELSRAHEMQYLDQYLQFHKNTGQNLGDPQAPIATAGLTREQLEQRAESLQDQLEKKEAEMQELGSLKADLDQMTASLKGMQSDEIGTKERIEHLQDENGLGGRLTVTDQPRVPLAPFGPDRRPKLAAMGAMVGACLPLGLAILLATTKRRYRYADEATGRSGLNNIPLLGLLPDVGAKRNNPELLQATAHGVHHLRVLLCSKTQRHARQTYLVTSATEGEGKTNLTVALGMSFAASKQRTLVIDGDFVGRRLTEGFKAQQREGLFDALQDGAIKNRVVQVEPMLFLLPAGRVAGANACEMTPEAIRGLLDEACREFDTILIDSGPILGSLEAAVLAQESDGVILTIARGQHPSMMENAMRRLNMIGASLAGVVFNRAKLRDFHNSAYASTASSVPSTETMMSGPSEGRQSYSGFGPLVQAVARTTPAAA